MGRTPDEQDVRTYLTVLGIGEMVFAKLKAHHCWAQDQRRYGVNYSGLQTAQGLYLIVGAGAGIIHSVITPWGTASIVGPWGGSASQMPKVAESIMRSVVATKDDPARTAAGLTGHSLFALRRFGEVALPEPRLRADNAYLDRAEAQRQWLALDQLTGRSRS